MIGCGRRESDVVPEAAARRGGVHGRQPGSVRAARQSASHTDICEGGWQIAVWLYGPGNLRVGLILKDDGRRDL